MSIANHKGGFSTTLRVTQNNKNETLCMLDKPFLKKAENWSLQVTDFFINKVQALNLELEEPTPNRSILSARVSRRVEGIRLQIYS